MAVRLRNDEKVAILALLEREYKSESEAAATVLREVAALLAERDSFGVVIDMPGIPLAYGPWYDLATAKKVILEDDMRIFRLHSPAAMMRRLEPSPDKRYCECGHPRFAHIDHRWTPWKGGKQRNPGCMACACTKRG